MGFRLANQNYIFRIESIQEIVMPSRVAKIPEVPAYVDGVSNLRGMIIPIINLRSLFSLKRKPYDENTRTIVVNVGTRTIGCTVDSVLRVMRVPAANIQPAPDSVNGTGRRFIAGFTRVDEELFVLLNADQLLEPSNLDQVHQASIQFEKKS
ncbi:chemotaxis protein CheW [Pirellulales bacterium]|nr:chemotaxis protein CheW [Pirellulales bacterium]